MEMKSEVTCPKCKHKYEAIPQGRYSVDPEGRVYFDCVECKQEVTGAMKPIRPKDSQPIPAYH